MGAAEPCCLLHGRFGIGRCACQALADCLHTGLAYRLVSPYWHERAALCQRRHRTWDTHSRIYMVESRRSSASFEIGSDHSVSFITGRALLVDRGGPEVGRTINVKGLGSPDGCGSNRSLRGE
jgi:hypothetical protein